MKGLTKKIIKNLRGENTGDLEIERGKYTKKYYWCLLKKSLRANTVKDIQFSLAKNWRS